MFPGQNKEPHPFHVKSSWVPPIQPSVALETYLEEVITQLVEVKIFEPKNNLPHGECLNTVFARAFADAIQCAHKHRKKQICGQ